MGVAVDETARVLESNGRPFQNVFAAGEIMSGNILTQGLSSRFWTDDWFRLRGTCRKGGGAPCSRAELFEEASDN